MGIEGEGGLVNSPFVTQTFVVEQCFCISFFHHFIPRPLLLYDSQFLSKVECRQEPPLCVRNSNCAHKALKCSLDIPFLYQFFPRPLLLWESQFLSKVELQTGTLFECAAFTICSQGSKMFLQIFPSLINLFSEHSFYKKVKKIQKWSCKQEPPLSVRISIYSQTTPSMRKSNFCIIGVAECCFGIQLSTLLHCTIVHNLAPAWPQFYLRNLSKH